MKLWTYGEIRTKVQNDLDLTNEVNITADEYVEYCNEAIKEAESEILKISEDYLLTSAAIAMVSGTANYSLPTDVFASKIRDLIYDNGAGIIYKVKRVRGDRKFIDAALTNQFGTALDYRYLTTYPSAASGFQLKLVPPARETGSFLTLWYIRNATRVPLVSTGSQGASDASILDIPEFYTFIIQFMKCRCLEKDGADPRLMTAMTILTHEKEMMVSTLTEKEPDDDNTILPDFTHYTEHE